VPISIVVATFGSEEWRDQGNRTAEAAWELGAGSVVNVHLPEGTLAQARNQGAEDASTEWLCFLDADDELDPGFIPAMRARIEGLTSSDGEVQGRPENGHGLGARDRANARLRARQERGVGGSNPGRDDPDDDQERTRSGGVHGGRELHRDVRDRPSELGVEQVASAGGVPGRRYLLTPAVQYVRGRQRQRPRIWPAIDLRVGNYLVIGTLVQRDLFLEVGGFQEWPIYEDWCLWQRCWKAGAEIVEVPEAVYVAHARSGSRNRGPRRSEKLRAHREIVAANFPEWAA
jgi:glycosyltransferase involved in cell wall biosynthesis